MSRIIVVMGVAGSGKTSVGRALAARWRVTFLEGDAFHPPANVRKMQAGEPLTDADRRPWLDAMHDRLRELAAAGESAVLACSALKRSYRERLSEGVPGVCWVHLRVSRATAQARTAQRTDHFMPAALIDSQFEALEEPDDALVIDGEAQPQRVVDAIATALEARG